MSDAKAESVARWMHEAPADGYYFVQHDTTGQRAIALFGKGMVSVLLDQDFERRTTYGPGMTLWRRANAFVRHWAVWSEPIALRSLASSDTRDGEKAT